MQSQLRAVLLQHPNLGQEICLHSLKTSEILLKMQIHGSFLKSHSLIPHAKIICLNLRKAETFKTCLSV